MNEISRIHIAKVAYDIEVAAKKQLNTYLESVEAYTKDKDVLADVELRITELLAERGVQGGGVITSDDIAAVRAQLGEPHEFADEEGAVSVGAEPQQAMRRLYRSTDNAVVGGVLSGIAAYFRIDPVWVRLIFIVLLFASFGSALLVYVILWIVVPPARTAAEKLQLAGRDVTLASIKELSAEEEAARPSYAAQAVGKALLFVVGIASALGATLALVGAVLVAVHGFGMQLWPRDIIPYVADGNGWVLPLLYGLVVIGLLLLTTLFVLASYALFARKLTKRVAITGAVIIALGISVVASTVSIGASQVWRFQEETREMERTTNAQLPAEFSTVKTVKFVVTNTTFDARERLHPGAPLFRYVVDSGTPRYELSALPTVKQTVTVEGDTATITLAAQPSPRNAFSQPIFTLYGPALQALSARSAQVRYEASAAQPQLDITLEDSASLSVGGRYETVQVRGNGATELLESQVKALTVTPDKTLHVSARTVEQLTVEGGPCQREQEYDRSTISVEGVSSGQFTYGGVARPAVSEQNGCLELQVGETYERDEVLY